MKLLSRVVGDMRSAVSLESSERSQTLLLLLSSFFCHYILGI